jgi:putative photosynthetic complex assembly protein
MSAAQTHPQAQAGIPRGILIGASALVTFAILASAFARLSDIGTLHMPQAKPVETIFLRFEDRDDGGVAVRDAATSDLVFLVQPGTNGFIRATLRGLAQERKRSSIGDVAPFRLTRWTTGSLSLDDETTGRHVNLEAFGPTNSGAFAQFFKSGDAR